MKKQFRLKKVYKNDINDLIKKSLEIGFQKKEIGDLKISLSDDDIIMDVTCDCIYNYALNNDMTFGLSSQNIENYLNQHVAKFTRQKYIVTEII